MAWHVVRAPVPLQHAGGHAAPLSGYLRYVAQRGESGTPDAPLLTLDEWRTRERERNAKRANVRNVQRCNTRHVREWRVAEWVIGRNAPLATRIALRARHALLPELYRGTLSRDGMSQDATRIRAHTGKYLEHAAPLSALVAYHADRRGYFRVRDAYSTHGARIAATLAPMQFTTHAEGRET